MASGRLLGAASGHLLGATSGHTVGAAECALVEHRGPTAFTLVVHPCSGNDLYRVWRGRLIISAKGHAFKKKMTELLQAQSVRIIHGPVALLLEFYFKTHHRRDLDNYAKGMLDSLKGVLFDDDSDIYDLRLTKMAGANCDMVRVTCCST